MNNVLRLVVLLGLVTSAWAQIDTQSIPSEQDQRDLFARAAASRLVIIGKVIKSEGKSERIAPEALHERLRTGTDRGGGLKTVQVEEVVCQQSDFDNKVPRVDDRPQPFYLFVPFDELDLPDGYYREVLLPNERYLLLLSELDSGVLSSTWELDPNRIYYRGTGHNRGVIPLEPETPSGRTQKPPEVVDEFRQLCAAMRPPKPEDKLGLLEKLAESGDPVLQKEAEIAEASVKASMQGGDPHAQLPKKEPR